jgi:hypothetical protein
MCEFLFQFISKDLLFFVLILYAFQRVFILKNLQKVVPFLMKILRVCVNIL